MTLRRMTRLTAERAWRPASSIFDLPQNAHGYFGARFI
jgi:hypothetical protein